MRAPSPTPRSPGDHELAAVLRLVVAVAIETYGGECPALADTLRRDSTSEFGTPESWRRAIVTGEGDTIAGVALVEGDLVSDLWVRAGSRGLGHGTALLAAAEAQVLAEGHATARLNVVSSNETALSFYRARGWVEVGRRPSPRWALPPYVDLEKRLGTGTVTGADETPPTSPAGPDGTWYPTGTWRDHG